MSLRINQANTKPPWAATLYLPTTRPLYLIVLYSFGQVGRVGRVGEHVRINLSKYVSGNCGKTTHSEKLGGRIMSRRS
jgi:hypothetical protein